MVVVKGNRRADQEVDDPSRDGPAYGVDHAGVYQPFESLAAREDPEVEYENGNLNASEGRLVGSLESEADLNSGSRVSVSDFISTWDGYHLQPRTCRSSHEKDYNYGNQARFEALGKS